MDAVNALKILIAAMLPIGELRLSIPYGILGLKEWWLTVFLVSVVGNIIPVVVGLPLLDRVATLVRSRPNPIGRLLDRRVEKLQMGSQASFLKWGAPALALFVAVPLPLTGAWTGALAAWVFRIPFRVAVPTIFAGVLIAGVIVTLITMGALQVGEWLLAYGH